MLAGAAMMAAAGPGLSADAGNNPYAEIVTRNAFALKPPPPPQNPADNQPPPTMVDVYLTGISTLSGTKKVFLQIVDKGPGKKAEFPPPLTEGEGMGRVDVVSIDPKSGQVVVKVDGNERTLNIEKDVPKPAAAAAAPAGAPANPLVPGAKLPTAIPLPGVQTAAGAAAALQQASGGVVVGGGGGSSGVVVGGGASPAPAAAATTPTTGAGVFPGMAVPGSAVPGAASTLVPTRPLRTGTEAGGVFVGGGVATTPAANPAAKPQAAEAVSHGMTREQVFRHVEEQRALVNEAERLGLIRPGTVPPLPPLPMPGGAPGAPGTPVQQPPR